MQTILQKQFVFTPQDDKTTIPLQFSLADPIQGLRIAFQYGPQNVEPIRAQALIMPNCSRPDCPPHLPLWRPICHCKIW